MYVCSFDKHRSPRVVCDHVEGSGLCPDCYKVYRRAADLRDAEIKACADCQEAQREANFRIQRDQTIDPSQPYGEHVALYCEKHPDLRWSTKNIEFIGARSIFYTSWELSSECECSSRFLKVVPNKFCARHMLAMQDAVDDQDKRGVKVLSQSCDACNEERQS